MTLLKFSTNFVELVEVDQWLGYMAQQTEMFRACVYAAKITGLMFMGSVVFNIFNGVGKARSPVSKPVIRDYEKYRKLLGWLPVETIRRTFEATTQLAKELPLRYPLRRHIKSRNPALNRKRLNEGYATDTLFASDAALGGYTCAQLFVGLKSHFTQIYGLHRESEGPSALDDFVREFGAPVLIRNDNSKMQTGNAWREILRKYCIGEQTTEPNHPNQNPAERRIQDVKKFSQKIMDRTGAPSYLWLFSMLYVVYLFNRCAMETLAWRTPHEMALGETPDLSALLQFSFYEPVYYFDEEASYPETKEKFGHFLGIAENCGDVLTFWVLKPNRQVIARSVVRSALVTAEQNKRQPKPDVCLEGSDKADDSENDEDTVKNEQCVRPCKSEVGFVVRIDVDNKAPCCGSDRNHRFSIHSRK